MKICKDGRIWGQNNKEAGNHLGSVAVSKLTIKKGPLKTHWWRTGGEWNKERHPDKPMLGRTAWNKGKPFMALEKHPLWKDGISKQPNYHADYVRKWRKEHPEQVKLQKKVYYYRKRMGVLHTVRHGNPKRSILGCTRSNRNSAWRD